MTHTVIKVVNLSKQFKSKQILQDISFEVKEGDCLALIGPNGAGKTTLMNCLLGDYVPTSGTVEVFEKLASHPSLKEKVGILFQENQTEQKMKVSELLDFQKEIYPTPLSDNR